MLIAKESNDTRSHSSVEYISGQLGFDLGLACDLLEKTSWGAKRPRSAIERSFSNSWVLRAAYAKVQIGFLRIVSDFEFYAHIGDIYVAEQWRLQGVGSGLLIAAFHSHELQRVTSWHATSDVGAFFLAHGFRTMNADRNFVFRKAQTAEDKL